MAATVFVVTWCAQKPQAQNTPTNQVAQAEPTQEKIITNYGIYSPAAVAKAKQENKDVALFFHSKTCGSCAQLNKDIEANGEELPEDLVVLKTDWDDYQALAKQYNVEKYHTVAFLDGDTSNNVKGLFTVDDIVAARDLPSTDLWTM